MPYPSLVNSISLTQTGRSDWSSISGDVRTSMVDLGASLMRRVMLRKVVGRRPFSLMRGRARLMFVAIVFVCTAALAILDRLDVVDEPMLAWWLAERQLPNGGLNGRPEKLEDVRPALFSLHTAVLMSCMTPRFATAFGCSQLSQSSRNSNG